MNYEHFMNTQQVGLTVRRPVIDDETTVVDITAEMRDGDEYGPEDRITMIRVAQTGQIVYDGYIDNWREFAAWVMETTGREFRGDDLDCMAREIGEHFRYMMRAAVERFQ